MPFLFKLKRPYNHIAGGGFFVAYSTLPISLAWEVFGEKNGAQSKHDLLELIGPLLKTDIKDPEIGCTVLTTPSFLDRSQWLAEPPGWAGSIVRGKMYDSLNKDGQVILDNIMPLIAGQQPSGAVFTPQKASEQEAKYGEPQLIRPRLGQGSFRVLVTDAYKRKCAITGENTLVALEAAHIVPYSEHGDHDVRNGLLLRADFHRLFDVGLVSVTPDLRIRVSPRIRETWFNGKVYYRLDGQPLSVIPEAQELRPDPDRLHWHFSNKFQA
jgi:putative restriction endonuclease